MKIRKLFDINVMKLNIRYANVRTRLLQLYTCRSQNIIKHFNMSCCFFQKLKVIIIHTHIFTYRTILVHPGQKDTRKPWRVSTVFCLILIQLVMWCIVITLKLDLNKSVPPLVTSNHQFEKESLSSEKRTSFTRCFPSTQLAKELSVP